VFQIPIDTSLVKTCQRGVHEHDDIHFVSVITTLIIFFVTPKLYDMVWLNEYKKRLPSFITDWTDVIIPRMNGLDLSISSTIIFIVLY
jgi:hypothetical protein